MSDSQDQIYMAEGKTALRFFFKSEKNNFISERDGAARYDNVLYVEVMTPASKESAPTLEIERVFCAEAGIEPMRYPAYERFSEQVTMFKKNNERGSHEGAMQGTPLEMWPAIDAAMVAQLKAARVFTVEQLTEVPDSALPALGMGARLLRDQALQFVANISFSASPNNEMLQRIQLAEQENEALRQQITAMQSQLAGGTKPAQEVVVNETLDNDVSLKSDIAQVSDGLVI